MTHRLRSAANDNTLRVDAETATTLPAPGSVEHHFKEHQWGFGTDRAGNQVVYEVRHPHWEVFPIRSVALNWNWEQVYGPEWAFLQQRDPVSVILAAGSEIEVYAAGSLPGGREPLP